MNQMRIAAPLCRPQDVKPLAQAGADEFYCGVFTHDWRRFGGVFGNVRAHAQANLRGFAELAAALAEAKACHRELYLCVNNHCKEQWFPVVLSDISRAAKMGVSGFIVSDPVLIPHVRRLGRGFKVIVSTMAGNFNAQTLGFFAELGADRLVLDRQLTLKEIAKLAARARAVRMDLEVFALNITCLYVNACCGLHYGYRRFGLPFDRRTAPSLTEQRLSPCRQKRALEIREDSGTGYVLEDWADQERCTLYCAACSLAALRKCGISHAKIIGRGFESGQVLADVRFIRAVLDLVERPGGRPSTSSMIAAARAVRRRIYGADCHAAQCWHGDILRRRRP